MISMLINLKDKINGYYPAILGLFLFLGLIVNLSAPVVSAQKVGFLAVVRSSEQESLNTISGTFSDYIPYIQFNNYLYEGNGLNFHNQYTILEYSPDENGIFQIVMLIDDRAVACVYQLRNNGLYELARFDNYGVVEDLRYTEAAQDGEESLVFSSNMTLGHQYSSGFQNQYLRTIRAILPSYVAKGYEYREVVVIEETGHEDGSSYMYYVAPKFGIITVDRIDSAGTVYMESELAQVFNTVE